MQQRQQVPGAVRRALGCISKPLRWMLGISLGMAIIWTSILTIGIFLGVVAVLGMWLTVESIPGLRWFGRTTLGMVVLSILGGLAVHTILGTSTATGMIAAGTALVLKYMVLQIEKQSYELTRSMNVRPMVIVGA